jgi:hypothetical protein
MATLEFKKPMNIEDALELDMKIFKAIKAYRLQSLGKVAVEVVVDRLNLEPFYEFLVSFNCSKDLPYHNQYHAECVLLNCYEGAWHSKIEDEELRGLCAGALLHDFNHSGGKLVDSENIKLALEGLKVAQAYAQSRLLGLSSLACATAFNVIKITQYPFVYEPSIMTERIIRDADLMQPYEESPAQLRKQYLGLKDEIELMKCTTYTRSEFAQGCKTFQDNETNWHTEWALNKANDRNWEMVKSHLVKVISGVDND